MPQLAIVAAQPGVALGPPPCSRVARWCLWSRVAVGAGLLCPCQTLTIIWTPTVSLLLQAPGNAMLGVIDTGPGAMENTNRQPDPNQDGTGRGWASAELAPGVALGKRQLAVRWGFRAAVFSTKLAKSTCTATALSWGPCGSSCWPSWPSPRFLGNRLADPSSSGFCGWPAWHP